MENETQVVPPEGEQAPAPETKPEEKVVPPEGETVEQLRGRLDKEIEARRQLTARATKAEADKKALEAKVARQGDGKASLDVGDYIDISTSLEGLDQREKAYLAEQHQLSGRPLSDIRKDENFLLWQDAYRAKVEKERALKPSGTQTEGDKPKNLTERLRDLQNPTNFRAGLAEQEKLLEEAGYWRSPKQNPHKAKIG